MLLDLMRTRRHTIPIIFIIAQMKKYVNISYIFVTLHLKIFVENHVETHFNAEVSSRLYSAFVGVVVSGTDAGVGTLCVKLVGVRAWAL